MIRSLDGRSLRVSQCFSRSAKVKRGASLPGGLRLFGHNRNRGHFLGIHCGSKPRVREYKSAARAQCIMRERPRKYLVEDCGAAEGS